MVTIQQARAQIQTVRTQVQQQREQIKRVQPRALTVAEKRRQTREDIARRKIESATLVERKKEALEQLRPIETQIQEQEKIVKEAEVQQKAAEARRRTAQTQAGKLERDIKIARKAVISGRFIGLSKEQRAIASNIREAEASLKQFKTKAKVIREELDVTTLQFKKLKPAQLEAISLPALKRLEEVGAITVKKIPKIKKPTALKISIEPKKIPISFIKDIIQPTGIVGAAKLVSEKFIEVAPSIKGSIGRLFRGEPLLISKEKIIKIKEPTIIKPLPEDVLSFKELIKRGHLPGAVRKAFKSGGEELFKLSAKLIGKKTTPTGVKKAGKILGETALFVGFLSTVPTRAEIARQITVPAQVKILGVKQKVGAKGMIRTEVVYEAKKGGVREIGRASGVGVTTPVKGRIIVTESEIRGLAGGRALTLPGKVKIIAKKTFAGAETGVGVISKGELVQVGVGKVAIKPIGKGEIVKYTSTILQQTKKSITQIAGGIYTPLPKPELKVVPTKLGIVIKPKPIDIEGITPIAGVKGLLIKGKIPTKYALELFKAPVYKKGAALLFPPAKEIIRPLPRFIPKEAALGGVLGVIGAQATTLGVIPLGIGGLLATGVKPILEIIPKERLVTEEIPAFIRPIPTITKPREELKMITKLKVTPTITMIQRTIPLLKEKLVTIPKTVQKLKLAQIPRLKVTPRLRPPTILIQPKPRITQKIPPPIPPGVLETATLKKLVAIAKRKQGVDVVVGLKLKKRKVIARNLPPFKALKKAQRFVDKNIEASYLLKPSGKKTRKKDIKPFNVGRKFRVSKTNPLFVVEKRKFRLDSPSEKRQIKKAKKKIKRRLKLI